MLIIILYLSSAVCLALACLLLARRWTDLRLLDPLTIKEEQTRQKREDMIKKRFDRMHAERSQPFRRFFRALSRSASALYNALHERLVAMEEVYGGTKTTLSSLTPTTHERVKVLAGEGRALVRDQKWAEAEKRFLDVLTLDPHCVEAYKGLGGMYLKQKLYQQAQETFQFIVRMKKADDATFAGLADIEDALEHPHEAEVYRLQAVEASPKQACRHAELAEYYAAHEDVLKAWTAAKRACELEPSSGKYAELALQIAVQAGGATEARARYQRFRLLSEDRAKFQYWREKVEALEREQSEPAPTGETVSPKPVRKREKQETKNKKSI